MVVADDERNIGEEDDCAGRSTEELLGGTETGTVEYKAEGTSEGELRKLETGDVLITGTDEVNQFDVTGDGEALERVEGEAVDADGTTGVDLSIGFDEVNMADEDASVDEDRIVEEVGTVVEVATAQGLSSRRRAI
ncbi:hypothetical protein AtubIFM57258_002707 [Aspergillus tubingensis]|nr:hypothetical protein AtubIFM57258_002707 [Aspergillus tubingensis]